RVQPEVMVRGLADTKKGSISEEALDEVAGFVERKVTAVAIGSGMSHDEETTRNFIRTVVENRTTPVVIDADGLNALAPFDLAGDSDHALILTPHYGEFKRLIGTEDEIED